MDKVLSLDVISCQDTNENRLQIADTGGVGRRLGEGISRATHGTFRYMFKIGFLCRTIVKMWQNDTTKHDTTTQDRPH